MRGCVAKQLGLASNAQASAVDGFDDFIDALESQVDIRGWRGWPRMGPRTRLQIMARSRRS